MSHTLCACLSVFAMLFVVWLQLLLCPPHISISAYASHHTGYNSLSIEDIFYSPPIFVSSLFFFIFPSLIRQKPVTTAFTALSFFTPAPATTATPTATETLDNSPKAHFCVLCITGDPSSQLRTYQEPARYQPFPYSGHLVKDFSSTSRND